MMRLSALGLRASVIAQLSILIVVAMLLCDVVMIRFAERDLLQAKLRSGRLIAHSLEGRLLNVNGGLIDLNEKRKVDFGRVARDLIKTAGFSSAVVIGRNGRTLIAAGEQTPEKMEKSLTSSIRTLQEGKEEAEFLGRSWVVIWPGPERMRLNIPAPSHGKRAEIVISLTAPLIPMYKDLRGSQKMLLFYILLDTIVLALAGMALLSRTVVRPIRKLLKMTEEYTEGDFLVPLERGSGSEIRRLSRSLSNMIHRLDENKKELKDHIVSLELANKELRDAQNEIIRSEKLASVGRLAAGVAHEIGNPIGIVLGYLEMMGRPDIGEEERADFITRVGSEITRINRIIRTLLDFSRSSEETPVNVCIHDLLMDTLEMLQPQPKMEGITTDLVLDARDDCVFADPGRLRQVFLNILMNSVDALAADEPNSGRKKAPFIQVKTRSFDGRIEIQITDNGPGIAGDGLSKVFDPFYTTKEPGKGTGLGLSVSYQIVEGLGGSLTIDSKKGEETAVTIELPLHTPEETWK
jgi:signal transduction histidine kinase